MKCIPLGSLSFIVCTIFATRPVLSGGQRLKSQKSREKKGYPKKICISFLARQKVLNLRKKETASSTIARSSCIVRGWAGDGGGH